MEIEEIDSANQDLLCSHYLLNGKQTTESLLERIDKLEKENPSYRFLLTLDDFGQASYTSMHSKMSFDLDSIEGHDLSAVASECFDDGEHNGYLSHVSEFFIRKKNIEEKLTNVSFEEMCAKGISLLNADYNGSIESFKYDLASLIDKHAYILKIPVTHSYEALYAFPNGYFSCDLNPMENVFLAKMLQESFAYDIIGIGASYLAFRRGKELNEQEKQQLIEALSKLYYNDFDLKLSNELLNTITSNKILILKYTE